MINSITEFRAWSYLWEWMIYDGDRGQHPFILDSIRNVVWHGLDKDEDAIFMQYTGFKIVNYKIYEGDILNTLASRYVVLFEDGAFYCESIMGLNIGHKFLLSDIMKCNPIYLGNIFEDQYRLTRRSEARAETAQPKTPEFMSSPTTTENAAGPRSLDQLVRMISCEIETVERRRDGLVSFLRTNAQYWPDHQSTVDFYGQQIKRLRSYLPN